MLIKLFMFWSILSRDRHLTHAIVNHNCYFSRKLAVHRLLFSSIFIESYAGWKSYIEKCTQATRIAPTLRGLWSNPTKMLEMGLNCYICLNEPFYTQWPDSCLMVKFMSRLCWCLSPLLYADHLIKAFQDKILPNQVLVHKDYDLLPRWIKDIISKVQLHPHSLWQLSADCEV